MINLITGLPNAIQSANGEPILLDTDYRLWIRFNQDIQNNKKEIDISYLFKDEPPIIDEFIYKQLLNFLYNPSITPSASKSNGAKILDYILDGEYIYSAFMQVYHIDLLDVDMHWHKFQALANNIIGEKTLWGYAKQMRGYKKPSKKDTYEKQCEEAKKAWSIPDIETEEEKAERERRNKEFDDYFAGTEYKGGGLSG